MPQVKPVFGVSRYIIQKKGAGGAGSNFATGVDGAQRP